MVHNISEQTGNSISSTSSPGCIPRTLHSRALNELREAWIPRCAYQQIDGIRRSVPGRLSAASARHSGALDGTQGGRGRSEVRLQISFHVSPLAGNPWEPFLSGSLRPNAYYWDFGGPRVTLPYFALRSWIYNATFKVMWNTVSRNTSAYSMSRESRGTLITQKYQLIISTCSLSPSVPED